MSNPIDLYSFGFWAFVAAAVLLVGPVNHPTARRWALMLVNLGFLGRYLGFGPGLATVILGAGLTCLALRLPADRRPGRIAFGVLGLAVLALFVVNKLPALAVSAGRANPGPILATIGFSYVALRVVDVARAVRERGFRPPDLAATINYLLPFHMLAAGPIQAYDEFEAQPAVPPAPTAGDTLEAIERIAAGVFKKFILANAIQKVFLTDFRAGFPYLLVEMQFQFLWLYLDFSAYSDVAAGIGRLLGVATPENFDRPYLARNVTEFWERWHISLSQFIRRNLFIPIQLWLMRRDDGRAPLRAASLAFTASFVVCGLWHQISWRWLAWGLFQAAGLIACNLYKQALLTRLGRKGVNRYLANRWIQALAIVLTFEFSAAAVLIVTYPFEDLSCWSRYSR